VLFDKNLLLKRDNAHSSIDETDWNFRF